MTTPKMAKISLIYLQFQKNISTHLLFKINFMNGRTLALHTAECKKLMPGA